MATDWSSLILSIIGLAASASVLLWLTVGFYSHGLSGALRKLAKAALIEAEGLEARSKRREELAGFRAEVVR